MKKFDILCEKVLKRFERASFVPGDAVTFKANIKSTDWFKGLDGGMQARVEEMMLLNKQGKPIIFCNSKAIFPSTQVSDSAEMMADITIQSVPGYYTHPMTLPLQCIDFVMDKDELMGTYSDPSLDSGDRERIDLKPKPAPNYVT
jgi:hypothetical protein